MASLQDDKHKLQAALKKFIQIPAFVCCPVMVLFIVAAKPIIILLYSAKWVDCVPYFQILCTAGVAVCLQGPANNAIAAVGKSNVFFTWTIIKRTITILLCVAGIMLAGMEGLLWCSVIGTWAVYVINGGLVSKHIGYSLLKQILDILPYIILSAICGLAAYSMTYFVSLNMYLTAVIQAIVIAVLYLSGSYLLKFEGLSFLVNVLKERVKK